MRVIIVLLIVLMSSNACADETQLTRIADALERVVELLESGKYRVEFVPVFDGQEYGEVMEGSIGYLREEEGDGQSN